MIRVLPRDAFNDANLLKCIGQLTLLIEDGKIDGLSYEYDGEPFNICQDETSGETYVENIRFYHTKSGKTFYHSRPMNSCHSYPLTFTVDNDTENEIYYPLNEKGQFQMSLDHF
jgi:hypothetical protein